MNVSNSVEYKIKINGEELPSIYFKSLKIVSSINLTLPTCILEINCEVERFNRFMEMDTLIEINFKYLDSYIFDYNFLVKNFDVKQTDSSASGVFSGILNIPGYIQGLKQEFFKEKSTKKVFAAFTGVTPDVQYKEEDDIQTWLRYNITEKEFAEYLYKHTYINNDMVLGYISLDKKMILRKTSDILKDKIVVSNDDKCDIAIDDNWSYKTNFDIISYKLSPTRTMQFYDVISHEINTNVLDNKSFFTKKKYNKMLTYKPFRTLIDCRNTYNDYLFSNRKNLIQRRNLHNYEISFMCQQGTPVYALDKLDVCSGIKFHAIDKVSGRINKVINGLYIVTKRVFKLEDDTISLNFTASRDYFNKEEK